MPVILLIEDHHDIAAMVCEHLEFRGYEVDYAADGITGLHLAVTGDFDAIILDLMLPDGSGLDLLRTLRREEREMPVLVLTALGLESDKVRGLSLGADDYITKPFSPRVLIARIKAVLRRSGRDTTEEILTAGALQLDPATHRVNIDGAPLELPPAEFQLLRFFMQHPERVYSRQQLIDRVCGTTAHVEERTVDVPVRRLRMALEPTGLDGLIQTVRGSGSRFSTHD